MRKSIMNEAHMTPRERYGPRWRVVVGVINKIEDLKEDEIEALGNAHGSAKDYRSTEDVDFFTEAQFLAQEIIDNDLQCHRAHTGIILASELDDLDPADISATKSEAIGAIDDLALALATWHKAEDHSTYTKEHRDVLAAAWTKTIGSLADSPEELHDALSEIARNLDTEGKDDNGTT